VYPIPAISLDLTAETPSVLGRTRFHRTVFLRSILFLARPISRTTDFPSIFDVLLLDDIYNLRESLVDVLFRWTVSTPYCLITTLLTKSSSILASSGLDIAVALERLTGRLKRVV